MGLTCALGYVLIISITFIFSDSSLFPLLKLKPFVHNMLDFTIKSLKKKRSVADNRCK